MDFELLSIVLMFGIIVFGGSRYKKAKANLDETDREVAQTIWSNANKGFFGTGVVAVTLMIMGIILFHEKRQFVYLLFFTFGFILEAVYLFRLKSQIKLSSLPAEFTKIVQNNHVLRLISLALVVGAFALNL